MFTVEKIHEHVEQMYLPTSSRHIKRFIVARESFISMLSDNNYILIGQYTGVDSHVDVICPVGHFWKTCTFSSFKAGVRCRVCANQCPIQTKNLFHQMLEENGYLMKSEYKNAMTNVQVLCPEGHEWNTCCPSRFLQGARCRICDGQDESLAKGRFEQLLKDRGDMNLTNYTGANKKVVIKFGECGHIVDTLTPSRYKLRKNCPKCSNRHKESHLARFTKDVAKKLFLYVELEYKVLKNEATQYYLPFDIYIPSVNTLIEIQGHQHYEFNTLFHKDESDFIYRQELDRLKKQWATSKGYRFIEIDIRSNNEETVIELLETIKKSEDDINGN